VPDPVSKLRFAPPDPPFHVVLVEPEIPQNTGSVGRLCAATGTCLHLVGHLGFDISEKAVRRAGMDYWRRLSVATHPDLDACLAALAPPALFLLSSKADRSYVDAPWVPGSALVFGPESTGLADGILDAHPGCVYGIPTASGIRSLNLASAASVVLYEALRRTGSLRAPFSG
jgi:tRNA (cytidine/uridine-2'-O-)-methyltransferase